MKTQALTTLRVSIGFCTPRDESLLHIRIVDITLCAYLSDDQDCCSLFSIGGPNWCGSSHQTCSLHGKIAVL